MEDICVANQGINHNTKMFSFHSRNINMHTKNEVRKSAEFASYDISLNSILVKKELQQLR